MHSHPNPPIRFRIGSKLKKMQSKSEGYDNRIED